jgi:hypothetical protein
MREVSNIIQTWALGWLRLRHRQPFKTAVQSGRARGNRHPEGDDLAGSRMSLRMDSSFHFGASVRATTSRIRGVTRSLSFRKRSIEFYGIAAASFLLISTIQIAAQEQAVLGQGNVSCRTWTEDRNGHSGEAMARVAWVLGYITAFNQYGSKPEGDVSAGRSTEQITASIDDHCRQNPADNVYRASVALVSEFRRKSGR